MTFIEVEIYGDKILEEELTGAGLRAEDPLPVWGFIQEKLELIEREQFDTEGGRGGSFGRWAQLDHTYQAWKFTHGLSIETMKATEALYESLTGVTADSVRFATASSFEFGSTLKQFGIHQDPPDDANFRIRYPVDLNQKDLIEMSNLIMNYVVSGEFSESPTGKRYYSKRGPGGRFVKRAR